MHPEASRILTTLNSWVNTAVAVARQTEAAVEAEWTRHLVRAGAAQLRRALIRLREITDPYQ